MFKGKRSESDNGWTGYGGPWPYTILREKDLQYHLQRLSGHQTVRGVDVVSFQPFPAVGYSQDRWLIDEWSIGDRLWKMFCVFDGHSGHDTVNYTLATLPGRIREKLTTMAEHQPEAITPERIADLLRTSIISFDEEITQGVLDLFPEGPVAIASMSDDEIATRTIVDGKPHPKVARCMSGSTVLIAVLDPERQLHVASLGDCQAVLGRRGSNGKWATTILSAYHNGTEQSEVDRVKTEHPQEPEVIVDDRVLGVIAVTRAIGDQVFKLPLVYSERVFTVADPGAHIVTRVPVMQPRHFTPPYLSNIPEIQHADLSGTAVEDTILVLASDGIIDVYQVHDAVKETAPRWVEVAAGGPNPALRLLRDGIGGKDLAKASFWITVEMDQPWVDDTTILVTKV